MINDLWTDQIDGSGVHTSPSYRIRSSNRSARRIWSGGHAFGLAAASSGSHVQRRKDERDG
jgi:hypothetical protein